MNKYSTDDVFGVSRDLPLNYVSRQEVDEKFIDSLSRQQHIVIYGSSKQGKTSLRKHCLEDKDYVVVSCSNKWRISDLHSAVLKECGFQVKLSTERTASGANKVVVEASGGISWPGFKAQAKAGAEDQKESGVKETFAPIELDPNDANDIIRALHSIDFNKFVVFEDFHYLPDETQKDFSFSLKTFHENSKLSFIVVGVWREENRLIGFNGDLTDRVLSVDVDTWNEESLLQVMLEGARLLNIQFDERFSHDLRAQSFESVHIVQEACRRACRAAGVFETSAEVTAVGSQVDVRKLIAKIVADQAGRYQTFLNGFSDGFQETDLEMPKWVIYAILCSQVSELEEGVRLRRISKIIKAAHPKGTSLNNGNITQILNSTTSLQNKKGIRPLIADYDTSNTRLDIVDKGFIIWLASQNTNDLLEELSLPQPVRIDA